MNESKAMKLAPTLLLCAALFGCSKNQDKVIPIDGNGSVDPAYTESPADKCYTDCDKEFVAGDAVFNTLDACMEEKCKDEPEISAARSACAPLDQGKVTYSHPIADHCMARVCCAEATACANNAACAGMSACFARCSALR